MKRIILILAISSMCAGLHAGYREEVLADQPLVYYGLSESAGATVAVSVTNTAWNGTYVNNGFVTYGLSGTFSNGPNLCVGLTNTAYLTIPRAALVVHDSANFTIEGWVRPRSAGMVNMLTYRHAGNSVDIQFFLAGGTEISIWGGWYDKFLQHTISYQTDGSRWYHVAWTREGSTFRTYTNGALVATTTSTADLSSPDSGYNYRMGTAGGYGFETQFYYGDVDELAFYDHALGAARLNEHYTKAFVPEPSLPLVIAASLMVRRRRA
jgi:hypothetical protein